MLHLFSVTVHPSIGPFIQQILFHSQSLSCWIYYLFLITLFWKQNIFPFPIISQHYRWHSQLKSFLLGVKDLFILHTPYYGCWWPGYRRCQTISTNSIGLVLMGYLGFSTRINHPSYSNQNFSCSAWIIWQKGMSMFMSWPCLSKGVTTRHDTKNMGMLFIFLPAGY